MQRNWPILGLLVISVMFAAGCQGKPGEEKAKGEDSAEEEEAPPVPVEIISPVRGEIVATYSGTAAVEAFAEADVIAKVGGEIRELLVEEGDFVREGQLVGRLDGDRLRLELKQAEADLQKLEREYKRNLDLHEKGLVSVGAYENIKFELEALRATHERAALELSYTNLRAPISGVIAERFVKVGNTINADTRVFHVTTLDPLIIYLHVPEKEYRRIRAGQEAMVQVDALKDAYFAGKVARISPVVDPRSGTFKVTIEVADESARLKPGMFGRVHIVYERHAEAILIPRSAILEEAGEEIAFVVEDGKAKRKVIQSGFSQAGQVEILAGLMDSDKVVLVGQTGLKDAAKVLVVNPPAGEAQAEPQPDGETAGEESQSQAGD